jgi:hypothetical protein
METYVLKKESPADLAKKYTGDPGRYVDLFSVNELTPSVDGMTGKPAFQADEWRENRRINIPDSWTRPGVIGRVALTDKQPGNLGYGVYVDKWDWKHPQWSGTNYTYWSIRVDASLKLLATYPPTMESDAARRCLAKSDYWSKMKAFLLTWNKPSEFVNAFTVGISRGRGSAGPTFNLEPEGVWYANPGDWRIANAAATRFATTQCAHEWTRTMEGVPGHEYTRTLGPTRAAPQQRFAGKMAGPRGTMGDQAENPFDYPADEIGTGEKDTSTSGGTCSVSPLTEVKDYLYRWVGGDGMESGASGFAKYWFAQSGAGEATSTDVKNFQRANYELVTVKKSWGCDFRNFPTGQCFRIPTSWPNPKADSKLIEKLRNADCVTPYKGGSGGGGVGPGTQGTDGIDSVILTGDDSGTTVLALLAVVGLAAVGGVYLYKQRSKR